MEIGKCIEKWVPYCPRGFIWAFLVDFLKLRLALTPEVDPMADARCEAIARGIGHVQECEDLEVKSAVVDLADDGAGGKTGNKYVSIHNIEIMLALQWLHGKTRNTQRAIDVLEKLGDLFDPEAH
jgi:hypothetical protein